jgi:carbonic anhydrase/acetyltransferase-like protein (isoleucine patch superfamily)
MSISAFGDRVPSFGPDAFVHPDATVIGDVVLEDGANVWPGAVLRGDVERIVLGHQTSFQDNSVAHSDPGFPVVVGAECVVGHAVILHGCTVGLRCLIGMGSTLLNGCEIGDESIVGANSLVTQGKKFPPRSLIMGAPARVVREVTDEDLAPRVELHDRYVRRSLAYARLGLAADLSAFRR